MTGKGAKGVAMPLTLPERVNLALTATRTSNCPRCGALAKSGAMGVRFFNWESRTPTNLCGGRDAIATHARNIDPTAPI